VFIFLTGTLFSQSGTLKGRVLDSDGVSTLPGANIYLKDKISFGTVTDINGDFMLTGVAVGPQTFVVSYTGYDEFQKEINIEADKVVTLDIILKPQSFGLETVIISAQALGQTKAINQQLNADQIANIVSADKIKELPDVNAAEAISRLPGVAINRSGGEGSKVIIRGLDPKFTAITVNGSRLPSTSGTDRSVDLSLISPELLSGIELFKSPTPDMDGDAVGGTVNLNIMKAPKERKIVLKGLGGYNALADRLADYKLTASVSQRVLKDKLGITATFNTERFNRSSESINQGWDDNLKIVLDKENNIFEQEGSSLTLEKQLEQRYRQNANLGLDYSIGSHTDINILGLYSRTDRKRVTLSEQYNVGGNNIILNPSINDSYINLFSISASIKHKLKFVEIDYGLSSSEVIGKTPNSQRLEFRSDRTPFTIEAAANREDPLRFYDFAQSKRENEYLQRLYNSTSGNDESINTAYLNFNFKVLSKKKYNLTFKTGTKYFTTDKNRNLEDFRTDRGYYLFQNSHFNDFQSEGIAATGVDPSGATYFSMHNFTNANTQNFITDRNGVRKSFLGSFDFDKINQFVDIYKNKPETVKNFYAQTNNYSLSESVFANYAMLKLKIGDFITLIPGVRHELSDNTYKGIYADLSGDFGQSGSARPDSADVNYGLLLPHLHLKIKPLSWFDIRASYSTTIARPDYQYMIPFTNINRAGELDITMGNPDLKPSVSSNYDLFLTAYSGKLGLFSVGAFYKNIKNIFFPFTTGLNNDSLARSYGFNPTGFVGAELRTFENSLNSSVRGLEFEYQTNLNFLPGFLKNFVLSLNYARLFSKTNIFSFREETVIKRIPPFTVIRQVLINPYEREVDIIGQARHIFNTSLGYDFKGLSVRGSAAYQGTKLSGYSAIADKDRFDTGFWRFDFAFKYKLNKNINLFLNANNLSDQNDVTFFRNERYETGRERFGTTLTFGGEYIIR
jgi:outer membrane receptor protein involved in Fe transport